MEMSLLGVSATYVSFYVREYVIYNMIVCITLCRMKSIFEYGELNIHVAVYLFGSKGA